MGYMFSFLNIVGVKITRLKKTFRIYRVFVSCVILGDVYSNFVSIMNRFRDVVRFFSGKGIVDFIVKCLIVGSK